MLALLLGRSPIRAARFTVQAHNYAFVAPDGSTTLTVRVGDQVTWVASGDPHTVTSGKPGAVDNRFPDHPASAGFLTSGQTFTATFTKAGTYPYFCEVHPEQMAGVVKVVAPSSPAPTARPTPPPTRAPTAAPPTTPPPTAAPTPVSPPTGTPSPAPSATPSSAASAAAATPSPTPSPALPTSANGGGVAGPLVLGGIALIGVALLLWRAMRQRAANRT